MHNKAPLIVTLVLDEHSFLFFDALRKEYFPAAINFLSAHLTLFHHLPSGEFIIEDDLFSYSKECAPLSLFVSEVKHIGKGVAYKLDCPALLHLHKELQQRWQAWLTPQDKQPLWPHVTVQNKVAAEEAKKTVETLQANFKPFTATGLGFGLWAYEGGPWRFVEQFRFANK